MPEIDPFLFFEQQFASSNPVEQSQVRLTGELLLHGSLGDWAREQMAMGEAIEAKWLSPRTKEGKEHNIYYLDRRGVDPENERPFHLRHIACGCIYESLIEGDPTLQAMFACETLVEGVIDRAEEVRRELALAEAWEKYAKVDDSLIDTSLSPVSVAMIDLLVRERSRSDYWFANLVGGSHELVLMGVILGRDPDELAEHAQELSEEGIVDFDGRQTVKLAA